MFLPQGSWVDTMRMYYNDTSATDSTAWFTVYDLYGNIVQEWAVNSSGNSGNGFNDTALISHTIDYSVVLLCHQLAALRPRRRDAELRLSPLLRAGDAHWRLSARSFAK